jgi:hypothetical protein
MNFQTMLDDARDPDSRVPLHRFRNHLLVLDKIASWARPHMANDEHLPFAALQGSLD